ncbi:uncharacterized protein F4822DRAFT_426559 [Hypoxylon trugodes]|uniref:uncharacterized protein n=1 Tax=Hypoxylon trugodes TaxID=326681 RepID=UPI00219ECCDC|nr:uncharacterized protein F4822DRAFT_426559 [Hypoxylon trugodes]KAI1390711.1 hypothetical protein F4822DRAFT_426559 [Hypoxylon trugodes]
MADSSQPIPVVVCGKAEVVGKPVIDGLKPEYDVILLCLGSQPTAAELPYILQGRAPPTQSSYLGSGLYSTPPVAVIMGTIWGASDVTLVQEAMRSVGVPSSRKYPVIMRNDNSIPAPKPPAPEYAVQLIRRMRECLGKITRGEHIDGPGEEGVVWY